jgi:hypothetical protein
LGWVLAWGVHNAWHVVPHHQRQPGSSQPLWPE